MVKDDNAKTAKKIYKKATFDCDFGSGQLICALEVSWDTIRERAIELGYKEPKWWQFWKTDSFQTELVAL